MTRYWPARLHYLCSSRNPNRRAGFSIYKCLTYQQNIKKKYIMRKCTKSKVTQKQLQSVVVAWLRFVFGPDYAYYIQSVFFFSFSFRCHRWRRRCNLRKKTQGVTQPWGWRGRQNASECSHVDIKINMCTCIIDIVYHIGGIYKTARARMGVQINNLISYPQQSDRF